MKSFEFIRESIGEIDIELQDYKAMSPAEFLKIYGVTKQQWYKKNQALVGRIDQHKTHKGHTYQFNIPGEDPWLNRVETRHFDDELAAERELRRLQAKYPGTTKRKVN